MKWNIFNRTDKKITEYQKIIMNQNQCILNLREQIHFLERNKPNEN